MSTYFSARHLNGFKNTSIDIVNRQKIASLVCLRLSLLHGVVQLVALTFLSSPFFVLVGSVGNNSGSLNGSVILAY